MNDTSELQADLRQHLTLCHELLEIIQQEGETLRHQQPAPLARFGEHRKPLLSRLDQSLHNLRRHRLDWQRQSLAERHKQPAVSALLQQNQELIMRAILLDRENEQCLLRRGLLPSNALPSVNRQRPHFVGDLYRRSGTH